MGVFGTNIELNQAFGGSDSLIDVKAFSAKEKGEKGEDLSLTAGTDILVNNKEVYAFLEGTSSVKSEFTDASDKDKFDALKKAVEKNKKELPSSVVSFIIGFDSSKAADFKNEFLKSKNIKPCVMESGLKDALTDKKGVMFVSFTLDSKQYKTSLVELTEKKWKVGDFWRFISQCLKDVWNYCFSFGIGIISYCWLLLLFATKKEIYRRIKCRRF